ncbi:16S rRNA methyltransferase [Oceanicola sp. 22II-s10i]|uniref:16S rRNA (uracil(1498)-N(3))-methyltransferase n=1 Tax=Oceanicola sp. 22II-s10i TaxID=1317116 RepID=UPI000B52803A|nr:16S rRNA (uracil(1498)-N(3))-methyltransferase [Oceanicola sp. 22II-s10i]OWU85454.1 16S rRNA methyltransferase [Oceanicola sp. 22II-s10i]
MNEPRVSPRVRLHVDHPLGAAQTVPLERDQAHYLFGVMRMGPGDAVALFNGRDGEWRAEVAEAGKRGGALACVEQTAPQAMPPDLWLLFAPVKKTRTDFIVEKAVELGVARLLPVQTGFTNSERIRRDRLQAHAVEAAEQCGATYVPEVEDLGRLDRVLSARLAGRRLLFCDEAMAGEAPALERLRAEAKGEPWAVLIGPEGGFSESERRMLRGRDGAVAVALGPRILRADTAAVAAITLWQSVLGDW